MSHELSIQNGKVEMGYVAGTARWHGLGNELAENAPIEQWIVSAGMDWRVKRSRVRYHDGVDMHTWDEQHILFRSDNKAPLGVVSDSYKVVQPYQALEFFRDLCEHNGFKMRTAGVLFGGRRYWALADIGAESYVADPKDRVKGRLLLVTSCDGSIKTTGKFVAECVVCNNTLTMARAESGKQVAVSHRSVFNPADVKAKLGLADGQFARFIRDMRQLAQVRVGESDADRLTLNLFGADANESPETQEARASRGYKKVMELFSGAQIGANLDGRQGSAWAWLNAVTQYADHEIAARSADNRFNSSQFGAGDALKAKALELVNQ